MRSTRMHNHLQQLKANLKSTVEELFGSKANPFSGFEPQPMVSWFSPATLSKAGIRAVLTSTIGQYGDRRDVRTDPSTVDPHDYSGRSEIWIDYVADTGDGFRSTFAVARVMAEETLEVNGEPTESGVLILFGGDQVYPDARGNAYRDRFIGPYDAAFRHRTRRPEAFLIPGNHDWYDGLAGFMSLFCRRDAEAAFERIATPQRRSYWAVKLPHDWVCFGLDWHIGVTMDITQREYFERILEGIDKPSKFILVVPNPVWVQYFQGHHREYHELREFIGSIRKANHGHEVPIVLSGDLHCYARYTLTDADTRVPRELVMAGGGGAYLYPTHGLPLIGRGQVDTERTLSIPSPDDPESAGASGQIRVRAVYPRPDVTNRMARRAKYLPWHNGALTFLLLGPLYLILNYILRNVDIQPDRTNLWAVWDVARFNRVSLGAMFETFVTTVYTASGLLTVTVVVGGTAMWAHCSAAARDGLGAFRNSIAVGAGLLHGAAHVTLAIASVWFLAALRNGLEGTLLLGTDILFLLGVAFAAYRYKKLPTAWLFSVMLALAVIAAGLIFIAAFPEVSESLRAQAKIPLLSLQVVVFSGFLGTVLLGCYLRIANRFGGHSNDVLACQSIREHKNFLRLHIGSKGELRVFPVGIDSPPEVHEWRLEDGMRYGLEGRKVSALAKGIEPTISVSGA